MNRSTRKAFAIGLISFVAFAMPASAGAQALAQTIQVLPPGGTGCAALPAPTIVAHVSEGSLHSFDVTLANASYVALLAQIGGQGVPFNYMTRFNAGAGMIKHHVDLQAMPIRGSLPVSMTLLSSPQGSPTCLTVISFSVSPTGAVLSPSGAAMSGGSTVGGTGTGGSSSSATSGQGSTLTGTVSSPTSSGTSSKGPQTATSSTTTVTGAPINAGIGARLQSLCAGNNALQLWFLLLAIYVVIAALTALARPPLSQKSVALPLVLVLVPLVLLLGLWYFVPSCRAAGWVPAASVIIAIAALLVAFRDQNPGVRIIPLPPAQPKNNSQKSSVPAVAQKPTTPALQNQQKPQQQKGR